MRITPERAKQIVAAFAARESLPYGDDVTVNYMGPDKNAPRQPTWNVSWHRFSEFDVDANTGAIASWSVLSVAGQGAGSLISPETAAKSAEEALRAMGLPADAVFDKTTLPRRGFVAAYSLFWKRVTPEGVPFMYDGAYVQVNPLTGKVWSAWILWSSRLPDNPKATLSKEQAIAIAKKVAASRPISKEFTATESELKVVHPNEYWSGSPIVPRYDSPTRTAWIVTLSSPPQFGGFLVYWVDATDGKILGGTQSKGGGRLSAMGPGPGAGFLHSQGPGLQTPADRTFLAREFGLGTAALVLLILFVVLRYRRARRAAASSKAAG